MQNVNDLIDQYLSTVDERSKITYKNRILRVARIRPDFLQLNDIQMKDLLINELKLNKYHSMNNIRSTMFTFYEYLVKNGVLDWNIFKSEYLSSFALKHFMVRNIDIVNDDDIAAIMSTVENNVEYVESAIRLSYECVYYKVRDMVNLKRDMVNYNKKLIIFPDARIAPVSDRLIYCLEETWFKTTWSTKSKKDLEMSVVDRGNIFKYYSRRSKNPVSEENRRLNCGLFIGNNCFNRIFFEDEGLDAHHLYCCGLVNKVVKKWGESFLINTFASDKKEPYDVKLVIKEFGLEFNAWDLKRIMKPYALKVADTKNNAGE